MFARLRQLFAAPDPGAALPTYIALVAQARNPFFYDHLAVPDTLDGRFELIVLHLFLLQHRLNQEALKSPLPERGRVGWGSRTLHTPHHKSERHRPDPHLTSPFQGEEFSRTLAELFFTDMDRSVRELGVADTGVRYRIKAMAKAYHGRLQAYTASLQDDEMLRSALARNLYGTVKEGDVATLAQAAEYVRSTAATLAATPLADITSGAFCFPAPETTTPPLCRHG